MLSALSMFVPPAAAVEVLTAPCSAAPASATLCVDNTSTGSLYGKTGLLTRAARLIAIIAGFASVILVVVGGFKYVTSNGDPGKITSSRDTILYALLGALLAGTAQSIVILVLNRLQ